MASKEKKNTPLLFDHYIKYQAKKLSKLSPQKDKANSYDPLYFIFHKYLKIFRKKADYKTLKMPSNEKGKNPICL